MDNDITLMAAVRTERDDQWEAHHTLPGGPEHSMNDRGRQADLSRLPPPISGPSLSFSSPSNVCFKKVIQMASRVARRYGDIIRNR